MLRLSLQNIGPYREQVFQLRDQGLFCLVGCSGIGKSTILRALVWLLTGDGTSDIVRRGTGPRTRVSVTLEYRGAIIYRQKHAELLQVTTPDNQVYQGALAESLLQQWFGSAQLFLAGCYIGQNGVHVLLQSSGKDKLQLLQEAALQQENVDSYIQTAQQKLRELQSQHDQLYRWCEQECQMLQQLNLQCNWKLFVPASERQMIIDKLARLPQESASLQRELQQQLQLQGQVAALEQQYRQRQLNAVDDIPSTLETLNAREQQLRQQLEQLEQAQLAWNSYQQAQKLWQRQRELQTEQNQLLATLAAEPAVPESMLTAAAQESLTVAWHNWERLQAVCLEYKLAVTAEAISKRIAELQALLEQRKYLPIWQQLQQQRAQLAQLPALVAPGELEEQRLSQTCDNIRTKIAQLRQQQALLATELKCPACHVSLQLTGSRLVPSNVPTMGEVDISAAIATEQNQLTKWQEYQANCTTRKQLQQRISELEKFLPNFDLGTGMSEQQAMTYSKELTRLNQLQLVTKPERSIAIAKSAIRSQQLAKELATLAQVAPETPVVPQQQLAQIPLMRQQLAQLALQRQQLQTQQVELLELRRKLTEIRTKVVDTQTMQQQLQAQQVELQQLLAQQQSWPLMDQLLQRQEKINEQGSKLSQQQAELQDWAVIVQAMIKSEYDVLEKTARDINSVLTLVLPELFIGSNLASLTAEIMLFKVNKNDNRAKPKVNLLLQIRDPQGERVEVSPTSLSGGESARVSLALTLAFRLVLGSPWLLLDEVFASFDDLLCDRARMVIKQHLAQVPGLALVVHHNDVRGDYEQELDLEKLLR